MSAVSIRGLSSRHDHASYANTCALRSSKSGRCSRGHQSAGCRSTIEQRTGHNVADNGRRTLQSHNQNREQQSKQQQFPSEPPSHAQPSDGRYGVVGGQRRKHNHQNRKHSFENSIRFFRFSLHEHKRKINSHSKL